jgi:hypothetical protein
MLLQLSTRSRVVAAFALWFMGMLHAIIPFSTALSEGCLHIILCIFSGGWIYSIARTTKISAPIAIFRLVIPASITGTCAVNIQS